MNGMQPLIFMLQMTQKQGDFTVEMLSGEMHTCNLLGSSFNMNNETNEATFMNDNELGTFVIDLHKVKAVY
ncbi:MAG: hypothetical protein BGO69_04015 [Bacteroidetes bacterium 46-16]|nr:MAG: hypothetical protein BGO69_04015 [Bacteroidetes bacterium 46-16]